MIDFLQGIRKQTVLDLSSVGMNIAFPMLMISQRDFQVDFFSKSTKLTNWQLADCNRHINCDH